ncbi:oligopeptide ABC transporter ATP-binding protein [Spiroplasma helicoides]|uniref:Oligopeptide ABC transporter ATP-binding protein n=1 Tax=Spiroplasma helicoides TaxID=216938 RepID=A0A1B3SLW0_9MOLU|nr:oligopeptide/dipeptide ABC transporter ATP-binding protein [Spiroplasma helicoides]AOG60914.1 oligopeptide ABC transporter ATP-binding protein [Spiroplasma helicoides]
MKEKILTIKNLEIKFQVRKKLLTAIRNVSLDLYDEEILAIVGESGSGKSVITKSFTGMIESNGFISDGSIIYNPINPSEDDYFKKSVDLVSMQKELIDKYTIKSIKRSIKAELKYEYKKIKYLKKINKEHLDILIDQKKKVLAKLENKHALFSRNKKINIKMESIKSNIEKLVNYEEYLINNDRKKSMRQEIFESIYHLKVDYRKINGITLIDKFKIKKIINYMKRIKDFLQKEKNEEDTKLLKSLLKDNLFHLIVNKFLLNKKKNKKSQALKVYFKENFTKYGINFFEQELSFNKIEELNKMYEAKIEQYKQNENIKGLLSKSIFSFIEHYSNCAYNFKIEDDIEDLIIKLIVENKFDNEIYERIIAQWNHVKKFKFFNKFSSLNLLKKLRGKTIATIFQDPMTSLNPLLSVGFQISEVLRKKWNYSRKKAKKEAINLLEKVGIKEPKKRYKDIPGQYSGGMRQRVVIAIALACKPKILICDEPTTALDVTIQAQILELIQDLQKEYKFAVVFITHDLGVVAKIADRVAVMYAGQIVEFGLTDEVFHDPKHPYTWSLLSSLPQLSEKGKKLYSIKGSPPSLFKKLKGDSFSERSDYALEIDKIYEPPMFQVSETHYAKTWLLDKRAPKINKPEILNELKNKVEE